LPCCLPAAFLCRLIVLDCLCQCRSQISPVGSIDRTVQCQQLHTVAFLAIQPMFCIRHSYTQLQRWLHCAPCCKHCCMSLCVCLVYAGVHAVQVQSVTRFLSHMFPMRSALKILNCISLQPLVDGLSCRLHLAAVTCCRALSVCRVEHSKHHHLECCTHLHTLLLAV
jgi:hypothetical protein